MKKIIASILFMCTTMVSFHGKAHAEEQTAFGSKPLPLEAQQLLEKNIQDDKQQLRVK